MFTKLNLNAKFFLCQRVGHQVARREPFGLQVHVEVALEPPAARQVQGGLGEYDGVVPEAPNVAHQAFLPVAKVAERAGVRERVGRVHAEDPRKTVLKQKA